MQQTKWTYKYTWYTKQADSPLLVRCYFTSEDYHCLYINNIIEDLFFSETRV
jgi:hypothetical protein